MNDNVEIIFWRSEGKLSKLFKSKLGHRNLLRKWFWSYHELKNPCSERVKNAFFTFLQIFEWDSWNHILRSEPKPSKQSKSKFGHRKLLRKWFWSYLKPKNECCERLKRTVLSFLKKFEWRCWNHFLERWGKVLKTI